MTVRIEALRTRIVAGITMHGPGCKEHAAVLTSGDPDDLLRGADDTDLMELHAERAAILEHDGGLPRRPAA